MRPFKPSAPAPIVAAPPATSTASSRARSQPTFRCKWFVKQCQRIGLDKGLSPHGLRKASCRRMAEAGCSAHEIASESGHMSLKEVQRYCDAADQARMALRAAERVKAARGEAR